MERKRTHITINCIVCNKEMTVRKDMKNRKGYCVPCSNKSKWDSSDYREKVIASHVGSKRNKDSIEKGRQKMIGRNVCPENLSKIQQDHKLPVGEGSSRALFRHYKRSATKRGIPFSISYEDFKCLIIKNCSYCGVGPSGTYLPHYKMNGAIRFNGIDRINNSVGYEIDNCTTACKQCNYAKRTLSEGEFREWIVRIYRFYIAPDQPTPNEEYIK